MLARRLAYGGIFLWDWVENSPDLLHGRSCKCLFEGVRIDVINKYSIFTYIADYDFCSASFIKLPYMEKTTPLSQERVYGYQYYIVIPGAPQDKILL